MYNNIWISIKYPCIIIFAKRVMPGNPFHIGICAQDVANVHYVFNDKSPWEAKHCSMSFIASQFDQGIPKFALPRSNIQNCKAHLPLKRLNITSHSKIIQNHTSHQHITTCINTPGLSLKSLNWTNLQKLRHRTTQRYTTKTYTKRSLTLSTWGCRHGWGREVAWLLGLFV